MLWSAGVIQPTVEHKDAVTSYLYSAHTEFNVRKCKLVMKIFRGGCSLLLVGNKETQGIEF